MNRIIYTILLIAALFVLGLSSCSQVDGLFDSIDDNTSQSESKLNEQPEPEALAPVTTNPSTRTETVTPTPNSITPVIPAGSLALFGTFSGGSQSDFIRIQGGNVAWESTHYKFLRYVPEVQILDEFGWTSSKSYSKSYIYGLTAGEWVYEIKCFTDSGRKDITRLDPKTGDTVGRFSPITTGDMYGGFTISGDKVYYRIKVTKDLLGNRRGGGDVMVVKIGGTSPEEILDYYDDNNRGRYYGIGNSLITIVTTYDDDNYYYDIYKVNPDTLVIGDLLYTYGSAKPITFYEGNTSLFWTESNPATGNIDIIKFTLSEEPVYFLEISETIPRLLSIDESDGLVLVTFNDDTPESPFYYLADLYTGDVIELDIDPGFYSKLKNGNGQFIILE